MASILMELLNLVVLLLLASSYGEALKIEVYRGDLVLRDYSDQNAAYEGRSYNVPSNPIVGQLKYSVPRNACEQVAPVHGNGTMWFAFIPEYNTCPPSTVTNLVNAGFQLMLSQSKYVDQLVTDAGILSQALITEPAFVDFLISNAIVGYSSNATDVYLKVWDDAYLLYEKLIIVFGAILLAAVLISVAIFCCSICCRVAIVKWRTRGLSRWRVHQLPRRRYHHERETAESCSICLEDFKEGENLRVLPCDHVFHPSCVDEWLQKWNRTCPLCKSSIQRNRGKAAAKDPSSEAAQLLPDQEQSEGDSYGAVAQTNPLLISSTHRRTPSTATIELVETPPQPTILDTVPLVTEESSNAIQT